MYDIKQKEKLPISVQSEIQDEEDPVTIYVWSSGFNSVGHVSLQIGGKKAKYKSDDPGNYFSIWPKSTPAGGLTSIWPLKGTLAKNLEEDCRQEAIRPKEDFSNLMEPVEILPVQPDKIFVGQGLDKQKMLNEFDRIEKGLNTGEVRYQLLPGVKVASFFSSFISTNPKVEIYNCVTLTQHLLEVGGAERLTKNPWATPSKFATQLADQPQVNPSWDSSFESTNDNQSDRSGGHMSSNSVSSTDIQSNYSFSDYEQELTTSKSEYIEDKSSSRWSDSSLSFFEQSNNEPKSYLQPREEESDLSYVMRMDALSN